MSTTDNQVVAAQDPGKRRSYPVLGSTKIPAGTMTFIERTSGADEGYLTTDDDSGANNFAGIAVAEADNSSGANGAIDCEVYREGAFELPGSGFAQGHVGDLAYAQDNWTVSPSSSSASKIGRIVEYISATKVRVDIDPIQA